MENGEPKEQKTDMYLYTYILEGDTDKVLNRIQYLKPWDKITNNGNTILHVAVSSSTKNHELLKKLLEKILTENTLLDSDGNEFQNTLIDLVNSDGSTLLHVAAIGGNIEVVDILVERNPELLFVKDKKGHLPLALSVSNMHTKTSMCLYEHMRKHRDDARFNIMGNSCEELVVLATSCQDFELAPIIINDYPKVITLISDAVLTVLAQNYPPELKFWERRVDDFVFYIDEPFVTGFYLIQGITEPCFMRLSQYSSSTFWQMLIGTFFFLLFGLCMLPVCVLGLPIWLYTILKALFLLKFVRLFVQDTLQIHQDASWLLSCVCLRLRQKSLSAYQKYYTNSVFEATRQNASTFVRRIMEEFPEAIWSTNEDGHNFIQYSVINRSEKIYNLLYEMSEHKNIYKTMKDSSRNNLLHLAARLAPSNKLNLISGAALQIQRELQWFKEVERFVCPLCRIEKNSDDETPEMVFTREHKDLVIEGENWIKKTAESYTITAALIITIVFAAAITVPGGNNQDLGIPIFTNNIAFTLFAVSDAISLFTAVTSLLMFLSILTARFSEQDFLLKLPTKLIIGLTMLFLSTVTMIIAFGATLFLVFGQSNLLVLIPIGVLTCLPITSFVIFQFPLIVELIRATYCGGFFVREKFEYFY